MKIFILLSFMLLMRVANSQSNDTIVFLSSPILGVIENSLGNEYVTIAPIKFPDTSGFKTNPSREIILKLDEFIKMQRFNLDSSGQVENYRFYIFCPVGEMIPTLTEFKIQATEVFMSIEYVGWDIPKVCWKMDFIYEIEKFTKESLKLDKIKETKLNCSQ